MLIHSLTCDIIIYISKFLEIEYIKEKRIKSYYVSNIIEINFVDWKYVKDKINRLYPVHNLYATCKLYDGK